MKKTKNQPNKIKAIIINFLSSSFYILFNLGVVMSVLLAINLLNSVFLGLILIVLAKWRVFAVKIRYWWTNIKSAIVDYAVGFSYVLTISVLSTQEDLTAQAVVSLIYLFWLLIIKRRTSERAMAVQALIAIFWINLTISQFTIMMPLISLMIVEMIVGYFVVWHYLANFDFELKTKKLISGFWGLTMTQLMWLIWHWQIGYGQTILPIRISQFSMLSVLMTYLLFIVLEFSYKEESKKNYDFRQFLPSIIFTVSLIVIIVLIFSQAQI